MFIPYTILRLRPRMKANPNHPLTQKELTEFVEEVIFVLKEELSDGYLTELEYHDYVRLFYFAIDRVLRQHPQLRKEAHQMTEPMIKLPSVIIKGLQAELADKDVELANKDAKLADKDAEIQRLKELLNQISPDNTP